MQEIGAFRLRMQENEIATLAAQIRKGSLAQE
jgi:hypothetical protein